MSSKKAGENPAHRKPKVSWATRIDPGLVDPKARPKGVADAHLVNSPELPIPRYYDGGTQEASQAHDWLCGLRLVGRSARQIRWVANPEGPEREPQGSQS